VETKVNSAETLISAETSKGGLVDTAHISALWRTHILYSWL
jgi:hypothetical protein